MFNRQSWPDIFLKCGIGKEQQDTSRYILAHLDRSEALAAPSTEPNDEDMLLVLPRRRPVPAAVFFRRPVPRALPEGPRAKRNLMPMLENIIPESLHVSHRPFTRQMLQQTRAAQPAFVAQPALEGQRAGVCSRRMPHYVWIVRAHSPRDGGWVRVLGRWRSQADAVAAVGLFIPMMAATGDYGEVEVRKTISFRRAGNT